MCVTALDTPGTGMAAACRTMVPMRQKAGVRHTGAARSVLLAAVVASISVTLATPALAAPSSTNDPAVDALIQRRLADPHLGPDVGLMVIDAATGRLVSSHAADQLMLPASNMKIVTAIDALTTMGAEHRFHTRVVAGVSPTDIVLLGGGDPLLGNADLDRLAKSTAAVVEKGAALVVHPDTSLFPASRRAPGWTGQYLPYVVAPVVPLARLGEYSPDPAGSATRAFIARLRARGVKARLGKPVDAPETAPGLADTSQHTVGDAVRVMLRESENNVAEVLYRQVALATGHRPTWPGARAAAHETLASLGIDDSRMRLLDGSGLSRRDGVSPRFLTDALRLARVTRPEPYAVMFADDALPVSGRTGTLASAYGRFTSRHSSCARGDVHAKTGSLFDTVALSGVAGTVDGTERIFSIIVNNRPRRYSALSSRQALDGLTATITGCWG